MFYIKQNDHYKKKYKEYLYTLTSFSNLFSENTSPYLDSRIAENLFCVAFKADNISRSDCSIDAKSGLTGIGIKTFLHNNNSTLQKIAEFNRDLYLYQNLNTKDKINKICELRNERLKITSRTYNTPHLIYHCLTRERNRVNIYETPMDLIDISNIKILKESASSISFHDGLNEYSFNNSKSVLMKRFSNMILCDYFNVEPISDPIHVLHGMINPNIQLKTSDIQVNEDSRKYEFNKSKEEEYIILPLYSMNKGMPKVMEKSGLNQWNASGRNRNHNEVYIPVSSSIHKNFPDFFPKRDENFELVLPNGATMSAKICQDNSKALMSNPNKSLGQWLLRDVLDLPENTLLTYDFLSILDIDSVIISKLENNKYSIDFLPKGSYEDFKEEFMK